jgi:hypothetical protein
LRVGPEQESMLAHPGKTILGVKRHRSRVPLPYAKPERLRPASAGSGDSLVHQGLSHAPTMPRTRNIETLQFPGDCAGHRWRRRSVHEVRVAHEFCLAGLAGVLGQQHHARRVGDFGGLLLWRERFCEVPRQVLRCILNTEGLAERGDAKPAECGGVADRRRSDRDGHARPVYRRGRAIACAPE